MLIDAFFFWKSCKNLKVHVLIFLMQYLVHNSGADADRDRATGVRPVRRGPQTAAKHALLNPQQQVTYDDVMRTINSGNDKVFLLMVSKELVKGI